MRILLVVAVVGVFGALFVIDTAALLRLTAYCILGGCGVPPAWIAILAGGLAIGAFLSLRKPTTKAKSARVRKPARPGGAKRQAAAKGRVKRAK